MKAHSANNTLIEALLKQVGDLEREIARLKSENEQLTVELAAARKNPRNSSKPSSSDITKPQSKGGKEKRRLGGQPGHKSTFRQPFLKEQIDKIIEFDPQSTICSYGRELVHYPEFDVVKQQIDLYDQSSGTSRIPRPEHISVAYAMQFIGESSPPRTCYKPEIHR